MLLIHKDKLYFKFNNLHRQGNIFKNICGYIGQFIEKIRKKYFLFNKKYIGRADISCTVYMLNTCAFTVA